MWLVVSSPSPPQVCIQLDLGQEAALLAQHGTHLGEGEHLVGGHRGSRRHAAGESEEPRDEAGVEPRPLLPILLLRSVAVAGLVEGHQGKDKRALGREDGRVGELRDREACEVEGRERRARVGVRSQIRELRRSWYKGRLTSSDGVQEEASEARGLGSAGVSVHPAPARARACVCVCV